MNELADDIKYVRALSVHDAIAALQESGEGGLLVAGGIVVGSLINQGLLAQDTLIDISRIDDLRRIGIERNGKLSIGALASHNDILKSAVVAQTAPLLVEIAKEIACGRLRNRGTIGGSLCMIGQQGDPATGLIALGAELRVCGPGGKRTVALHDFYRNAFEVDLRPNELVESVSVPPRSSIQRWGFAKLGPRNAMDWTQLAVSCVMSLQQPRGRINQIRIGMNGVAPAALLARQAEDALLGQEVNSITWPAVIEALNLDIAPESDVVFSATYKRHLAAVLLQRAISKCLAMSVKTDSAP